MGDKKKKFIITFCFFIALLIILSFNVLGQSRYAYIESTLINQDPYPAQPENYVDLLFKFENKGGLIVKDFMLEIIPEYPFSLDPGSTGLIEIGSIDGLQKDRDAIFARFRVRVDKEVLNGDSMIKMRYTYNTDGKWDNYVEKKFAIKIEDPKTDFDIAIQDYSYKTNTLSIAVSNTGNKDANSVTVILPDQESIQILGSNKNIVGTIDGYDYTIASFKVISNQDAPLIVRISYTDSVGIRREVEKAILFNASTYDQKIITQDATDYRAITYIVIGIIGIAVIIILFNILRKKRRRQ